MFDQDQPAHATRPAIASRPMRILVIDDIESDRERVFRLCSRAGLRFDPVGVASVAAFRDALDRQSFDLIFVDYLLAGETGLDAVDAFVAHPAQHGAAIMIAGEGQIGVAVEAMRRGCSDYLTKSMLSVETLQKSVATALERRMLVVELGRERAARAGLERSVREFAAACTLEMRGLLSATLRRVRELRRHAQGSAAFSADLGLLERDIDRLWAALPSFPNGLPAPTPAALAAPGHA